MLLLYTMFFNTKLSPRSLASFIFFRHIAREVLYTNFTINVFLHVISGNKFRRDLVHLFHCSTKSSDTTYYVQESNTRISTIPDRLSKLKHQLCSTQRHVGAIRCKSKNMPPVKRCRQQVCLGKRGQRQPSANHICV